MPILLNVGLLLVGFTLLYFGAEFVVSGSSKFAASFGIRKIIIGLTLVAFGTSAPEMVVSGLASFHGQGENALGNVVGSNIANIGLVLGITAMVNPLPIDKKILRWEVPLMIFSSVLCYALCGDGVVSRTDGYLLLLIFGIFVGSCIAKAKNSRSKEIAQPVSRAQKSIYLMLATSGLFMLWGGGECLIRGATFFAELMNVPSLIIYLTIVALGTSLPELVVSVMAALQKSGDISVGNIVGSNMFNVLLVLGIAAVINPIQVSAESLEFHLPVMVAFAVLLFPLMRRKFVLNREEGALLLVGFVAYYAAILLR